MNLTPFESEIIDSIIWQVKGYKKGFVSHRVTTRILRATIRRIKHRIVAESKNSKIAENTHNDHAVPVKVIVDIFLNKESLDRDTVSYILETYYTSVKITEQEHILTLKNLGLACEMPDDWDGKDPFARYLKAEIEIEMLNDSSLT